jgi:trimethylamine--corrinoid protein Co-methyltransferase
MQPVVVDEPSLGLEAIDGVGPGGHFFGSGHTLERYETAFYRPMISDWRNYETWVEDGSRTATDRAGDTWRRLLEEGEDPPMDPGVRESIDDFVDRRTLEIDGGG